MKLRVDSQIFKTFPELNLGVVIARQIDNTGSVDEIIEFIRKREKEIRENFNTETLSQELKIESWRKAYSAFGAKPKKYKSSVESLYRMILKGVDLRPINKIVDIYNYISIKHMIPAGGDDAAKVGGDVVLRFASGDEPFTALNSDETETVKEGEVVYADDKEVLCRRWNWRECDKTKMTEETRDVVLVVEGLPPIKKQEMAGILDDFRQLIIKYCGGEVKTVVLDKNIRETEI
ncbi:MAG: phenylalanine--tRNA ligase beta subunit-related protein [Candidatus Aminicenantes bacterium]|jgi:lysyl-tRNA synthetase class 2